MLTDRLGLPSTFWQKVQPSVAGCWGWRGARTSAGYANTVIQQRNYLGHRLVYEALVGPIPDGLTLDHLCRNRPCVDPRHLEPVTALENYWRGLGPRQHLTRTHCPHGHPYSGTNVIYWRNQRICRECKVLASQKRSALRREQRIRQHCEANHE